ncbi:MAG: ABC transporter permease [Thermoleophilia bacterium]|nr:ABC transporter permease [Thermoleophilia bacterium]MDH3724607.1 ABC transporter permease [Thermoleophilia bacterium]
MRGAWLIARKDLVVLLKRSPGTLLALVGYPLLVAVLVGLALEGSERTPRLALVNEDTSTRTVLVGSERLSADDYADRLGESVDVADLSRTDAASALEDGRVSAVLTIPAGFVADLQSGGARPPRLELATSRRDPLAAEAIERRVESALFGVNQSLSTDYVSQVRRLVRILIDGGQVQVFGEGGKALGLTATRQTVADTQQALRAIGQDPLADSLDPLGRFVDQTTRNLELAGQVAESIGAPIELEVTSRQEQREPLSAFGLAAALTLALGLAAALLAAGALASERDDGTLPRLIRGPVSPLALAAAKMLVAAALAALVALIALVLVALFTDIAVDRWHLWPLAVGLAGLSFGGVGALIGALARDGRSALLITLMVGLPLVFLGIVPLEGRVETALQTVGVAPVFDAFQTLLIEPTIPERFWWTLGVIAVSSLALWLLSGLSIHRRVRA